MNPRTRLAIFFPPWLGFHGACTTLQDISNGHRPRLATKLEAARTVMEANNEYTPLGHGNRARRRMKAITT